MQSCHGLHRQSTFQAVIFTDVLIVDWLVWWWWFFSIVFAELWTLEIHLGILNWIQKWNSNWLGSYARKFCDWAPLIRTNVTVCQDFSNALHSVVWVNNMDTLVNEGMGAWLASTPTADSGSCRNKCNPTKQWPVVPGKRQKTNRCRGNLTTASDSMHTAQYLAGCSRGASASTAAITASQPMWRHKHAGRPLSDRSFVYLSRWASSSCSVSAAEVTAICV